MCSRRGEQRSVVHRVEFCCFEGLVVDDAVEPVVDTMTRLLCLYHEPDEMPETILLQMFMVIKGPLGENRSCRVRRRICLVSPTSGLYEGRLQGIRARFRKMNR
jgi:hypothetical protein